MPSSLHRRQFLTTTTAGALGLAGMGYFSQLKAEESTSPNEKLNIGCIGVGGRGENNVRDVRHENIVALCDIDESRMGDGLKYSPDAKQFHDFRKMLEMPGIDAVTVSTADHTHAVAAAMALRMGKHVYCEKPISHTVYEARTLAKLAKENKRVTQLGTQIHAGDNYRRVVELIQSGAIGPVTEAHAVVHTIWGGPKKLKHAPLPKGIDWDLWIGPAQERQYDREYHPGGWRCWWAFGSGAAGDMGCHLLDLVHWSLDLKHPTKVAAFGPPVDPETAPRGLRTEYEFPASEKNPAVKVFWYDGEQIPKAIHGQKVGDFGILFVGEKGNLWATYTDHKLYPEEKYKDFTPPPQSIPASIGHHKEWTEACKTGGTTTCNFDYGGRLSENVLLGIVAYRSGEAFDWDATNLKTSSDVANRYLHKEYRKGWTL
ncbi:MAG: Gfo/Idh/MocA family oxidoreductase [Planctomycetota bacterium]|nr:Gfo/Idh/MocA family oxidoreductase [Planctomycetota bacterium]